MSGENGNTVKWRLTNLEEGQREINCKMDLVMENHLPHIQLEIAKVRAEMVGLRAEIKENKLKLGVIIGIAVFVANFLLNEVVHIF